MPSDRRNSRTGVPAILIAGPTAIGKSAVAMTLAERIGGEIISVDSMQVYRGLDIGTAKPSQNERQAVPHHLIDVVDLTEPFDAARFAQLAHNAVAGIRSRGRVPILCGGAGLYFKAFLEGLGEAPPSNVTLRAELEATPMDDLLRELEQCDPLTFGRIDRHNSRRVVRAVEVIRLTGKTFSAARSPWSTEHETRNTEHFFGLTCSSDQLRVRIDARVERMFARGLVRETAELLERGLGQNRTAMQAIGYRQVVEHLRGERSLADTIALVQQRTRQFAKRQMTWFRRQFSLKWVQVEPEAGLEAAAIKLWESIPHSAGKQTQAGL